VSWLLLTALIVGPLYAFSVYSFSEILTGVLLGVFVLAMFQKRSNFQIFLLTLVITSSRETAIALTIPLALAVLLVVEPQISVIAKKLLFIGSVSAIGLFSVFVFNIWKYGSITNQIYADPIRRVPGLELKTKNFFAVWISPSGGVLPFWFIGGLLVLAVPALVLFDWRRNVRKSISAGVITFFLIIQTGLLSVWFAPFGWVTWGPRLILPVVTATLIVVFLIFSEEIQAIINWLRFRFITMFAILLTAFLSGISNLGFILDRSATLAWFNPPLLPSCPQTANIEIDPDYYWSCALSFAPWQLGRTIWDMGLHQVTQGWAIIYGLFLITMFFGVFYCGYERRSAMITDPPASDGIFDRSTSSGRTNLGNSGNGTPTA
jgi:hypothetical protein